MRAAVLLLLNEEPLHGYQLIQQIGERSNGAWTPSPGSVYPVLSQLEDEGLITIERVDGRKTASLTDEGCAYVEEHREELGSPWDQASGDVREGAFELRDLIWQLGAAAMQVVQTGSQEQVAKAREVLAEARRSLYRILADDEPKQD